MGAFWKPLPELKQGVYDSLHWMVHLMTLDLDTRHSTFPRGVDMPFTCSVDGSCAALAAMEVISIVKN